MDPELKYLEYAVLILGVLTVAGILYESMSLPADMPSGYAVLGATPACCGDCSCSSPDVCYVCPVCCWASECTSCDGGIGSEGFKLVHSGRVRNGESFTVNAVFRSMEDREYLLELKPPNGFRVESKNPVIVDLEAGEAVVLPFQVRVLPGVAEKNHILRAEVVDSGWNVVNSAEARVSVYWENESTP